MQIVQQILFILLSIAAIWLFTRSIKKIRRNILLGRDEDHSDHPGKRWRNVLLLALGQKKMFRKPLVAILHFFIYAGFIIINVEVLEIILDGIFGTHRLFAKPLGGLYGFLINAFEILAILVLLACVVFLIRRNVIRIRRFRQHELDGWPRSDANYILITEILLMTLFLTMNSTDRALQLKGAEHYNDMGNFIFSGLVAPAFENLSASTLITVERTCWWLHIIGIFAFLNYLIFSKHLHILLAFPNAYYARLSPQAEINNMPSVQNEVLYAMQPEKAPVEAAPPTKFGAKDIFDLTWRNLLDAYSCTECGRCTAACPANITGKKLSPRKIIMDTRDRMEEVGKNIDKNGQFTEDGKNLLSYITVEELRACTTCQACVEECPVAISPLEIIVELRRSLVMEDSNSPQEWNAMFSNVENNFAPWKFSPEERDKWATELSSANKSDS
jgi:heterodisulfide reductase subunit C